MVADVAQRERAEDGVAQRVDGHVAVAVGDQAARMRHLDAAEHDVVAVAEAVDVEAVADAELHSFRSQGRGWRRPPMCLKAT